MTNSRPELPYRHANPRLPTDPTTLPPVKYQILTCQGKDLYVGRMKIETPPSGHAFILRRFDTGAISLTTMFRAAFPSASEVDEKREVVWVKANYDLTGTNGTSKDTSVPRLAGTWVNKDVAKKLAEEYMISILIDAVMSSKPDEKTSYRRSTKGKQAGSENNDDNAPNEQPAARIPSPAAKTSPAAKRRREMSPEEKAPLPVPFSPPPRRSNRAKSPSLPRSAAPTPSLTSTFKSVSPKKMVVDEKPKVVEQPARSSRVTRSVIKQQPAKQESESEESEDEDKENAIDHVASNDLRLQDMADQKDLIEKLTRERKLQQEQDADMDEAKLKRPRNEEEVEEKLQFKFKEPDAEVDERAVAGTRRVERRLGAREKSLAWGVTAFAFGLGVVTFLPNLF